jgi:Sulfotransferase domain
LSTQERPRAWLARNDERDEERLLNRRVRSTVKFLVRSVVRAPRDRRMIFFIFGCQRSGTTMLQQTLLNRSWQVLIMEEHDRRLVGDTPQETKWQEDSIVFGRIRALPFEVIAVKPLVESYRAAELLETAGSATAVWMLRHYRDVARSNLRRFGLENAHRDLQPFLAGETLDWHCRGATEETRERVIELARNGLEPLDAAALFWWTRNQLYFDQHLSEDERFRILRYERMCSSPEDVIQSLSDHIGISLPIRSTISRIRSQRATAPPVDGLDPRIEQLCAEMWDSFDGCPELPAWPTIR